MKPNRTGINQHNERGEEIPDLTPVEWPVGVIAPETLAQTIARLVKVEMDMQMDDGQMEDMEEADDFDIPDADEVDLDSQYEVTEMQEEVPFSAIDNWNDSAIMKKGEREEDSDGEGGEVRRQRSGRNREAVRRGRRGRSGPRGSEDESGNDDRESIAEGNKED